MAGRGSSLRTVLAGKLDHRDKGESVQAVRICRKSVEGTIASLMARPLVNGNRGRPVDKIGEQPRASAAYRRSLSKIERYWGGRKTGGGQAVCVETCVATEFMRHFAASFAPYPGQPFSVSVTSEILW